MDELRTRISEILFYKWDPLRVSGSNWPRDEYNGYVRDVLEATLQSPNHHPVTELLTELATEHMGQPAKPTRDARIAKLIHSIVHDSEHYPDHEIVDIE